MGLFMSKEERTLKALEKLCKQCAEEANEMFFTALSELKNGTTDQSNRIKRLNELSTEACGSGVIYEDEEAATFAYIKLKTSYGSIDKLYKHCLYTGIVFQKIQVSNDKKLSQEALERLEENDYIVGYIRPYTPVDRYTMLPGHFAAAENYILGVEYEYVTYGSRGQYEAKLKSVKELMATQIELF